ncbi:MAG: asparagine synthase-related protein [Aeropyrum sp.]|nr:asparagine synthase-related protein [Aeropyrum sp.]MCE4615661.1 asparagine synthase-related protein [Aeropyrum sp.]
METLCRSAAHRLASIVGKLSEGCECALLSGGIDTTFVLASNPAKREVLAVTVDIGGPDAHYASKAASVLGVREHVIYRPSRGELARAVDWVVRSFATIDPIEVAASAAHYLAASKALSEGCNCLLSGDGGDEMFLGYSFLLTLEEEGLRRWQARMAQHAWLPTVEVGRLLGLEVKAPLYSPEAIGMALSLPIYCMIGRGFGKEILRTYLEEAGLAEIAWRQKTPVTEGSGVLEALKDLAQDPISCGEPAARWLDFKPPSRLHAWLAWRLEAQGIEPPPKAPVAGCPVCGRPLARGHCRFCGAYVSEGGVLMHYGGG